MSRKLPLFFFSFLFLALASGESKDLPDLVRQVNQLKALDPSCPDPKKKASGGPETCSSFALFACKLGKPAAPEKRDPLQKKYEASLATYFTQSGPKPFQLALQALGNPVAECASTDTSMKPDPSSICTKAVAAALAGVFARTRTYSTPVSPSAGEPAVLSLDLGALGEMLSDETLKELLSEVDA